MGTWVTIYRHAESAMNLQPDLVGGRSNGTPLSERGIAEARALGRRLREASPPDALYASPAVRTRQTAELLREGAGWSHPGGTVIAVGHGIALRTLAWSLRGGGHEVFTGMPRPNLAPLRLHVDPDCTIHLDPAA